MSVLIKSPSFNGHVHSYNPSVFVQIYPHYSPGISVQGETQTQLRAAPVPALALTPSAGAGAWEGF